LNAKKNKGKKISLDTADRLFTGFKEPLNRIPSYDEFGVDVSLVLLFGSYLCREPEVGDIDIAVVTTHRANYDKRAKQLREAGKSKNIIEDLYGPQLEVLKFLKNRSPWFALHEMDELRHMKNVSFAIVHHTSAFQKLVALYERNQLTGEEFLIRCEEVRKAHAGPFRAPNTDDRK
jgi:predicted nucleotidyltransferase